MSSFPIKRWDRVHIQTLKSLSWESRVQCLDLRVMRPLAHTRKHMSTDRAAVLITGDTNGVITIYQSPLSTTRKPFARFTLQQRFYAHFNGHPIHDIQFHPSNPLFVSACTDKSVKIWKLKDVSVFQRLVKSLPHPRRVFSSKYSPSGLLLTACNQMIRMYGPAPKCSLRWSFKTSGHEPSVAWSSSNRFAASSHKGDTYIVRVWNSACRTIFKHRHTAIFPLGYYKLTFVSNDLLISSGSRPCDLYCYHIPISKRKLMKIFINNTALPFCRDVLKIILTYIPVETYVPRDAAPESACFTSCVRSAVSLSSRMFATCVRDKLRIYQLRGSKLSLAQSLSFHHFSAMTSYCYSNDGTDTAFVLACAEVKLYVCVCVISCPLQRCVN